MRVVVDAYGGDNAPFEIIKGAYLASKELGIDITLTGNQSEIERIIKENSFDFKTELLIVDTDDVISMHDEPTTLLKAHNNSSMALAFKELSEGRADAFVSAGSTGAVVSGATLIVKRINGVRRVAIGSIFPTPPKPTLVLDCGANADCTPDFLQQFAIMGNAYMNAVYGIDKPTIGLLNNGAEEHKGSTLYKETHQLLKNMNLNFNYNYLIILVTLPAPTVLPPSLIENSVPSSKAIGAINLTIIETLSPGITISVPAGNSITPVTSVVLK